MARVEMHCIAAAFDRGEIPGFPVLCVAIGGDGVEAGGGVGRSWVGGIRFFFVRINREVEKSFSSKIQSTESQRVQSN